MQQPKWIGEAIEKIKMLNHIQLACAPSQRDGHKGKSDKPKRVHIVNPEQTTQPVSGLAVDKLTQVMAQLQGAVEKLTISCGSSCIDSYVKPPVPFNRPGTGGANGGQRQEGPYLGNAQNQGYNSQRQGQGRFMIQCDHCDEWYHGSCVNITATDALDIQKYHCPNC
ncbi:hypothetical protein DPMN_135440 [Dreissena polymorpha]|uniref:PHD-type domain-containing protein n=1 Tax=Dreissena polymorpha TaxID=45954 RepID=A0A9D4G3X6_DREPO|nr:hypothetical protein DPMN_135440 [Dreissena polymorpha]